MIADVIGTLARAPRPCQRMLAGGGGPAANAVFRFAAVFKDVTAFAELSSGVAAGGLRVMLTGNSGTGKAPCCARRRSGSRRRAPWCFRSSAVSRPARPWWKRWMRQGIWRLERYLSLAPEPADGQTFEDIRLRFFALLDQALNTMRVVLAVDALNQLHPCPQAERLLWLRGMPAGFPSCAASRRGLKRRHLRRRAAGCSPSLTEDETAAILDSLVRSHHKELIRASAPPSGRSGMQTEARPHPIPCTCSFLSTSS